MRKNKLIYGCSAPIAGCRNAFFVADAPRAIGWTWFTLRRRNVRSQLTNIEIYVFKMGGAKQQLQEYYEWLETEENLRFQAGYEEAQSRLRMSCLCKDTVRDLP